MGNCGSSLNCTQCYSPLGADGCVTAIEVDPDVAGIGILIAFFFAAFVTCMSIFIGYISDSLPKSLLSETDEAVISRYKESFFAQKVAPLGGCCWRLFKRFFYFCTFRPIPVQRAALGRKQRVEALTRFLLAFSDQLLVTGLAMLIAALSNRCRLTVHEMRIVFCLAWFAAATHVATLRVLREYLYLNAVVRNWRLFAIVPFLVLLCFLQVLVLSAGEPSDPSAEDPANPVQCILKNDLSLSKVAIRNFYRGTRLLLVVLSQYAFHIWDLFNDPRVSKLASAVFEFSILLRLAGGASLVKNHPELKTFVLENASLQYDIVISRAAAQNLGQKPRNFRRYLTSFLGYIPTMLFGLSFGMSQTVVMIWVENPKTTDDVRRMGFGQVVAIALLVLPILAASEIYNGVREEESVLSDVEDNASDASSPDPITSEDEVLSEFIKRFNAYIKQPPQDGDEQALRVIHHEIRTQPIARDVTTFTQMTNDRRDFIAQSLLLFLKKEHLQHNSRASKVRTALQKRPSRFTAVIALVDAFVETFGAISYNTGNPTIVAANWLISISFLVQIGSLLHSFELRLRILKHHILIQKQIQALSKATGQANTTNQTSKTSPRPSISSSRPSTRSQNASSYLHSSPRSSAYFANDDEDSNVGDKQLLKRQDTEADIALVPIIKRLTFKQDLDTAVG